jgi:kynurenine formamidase
MSGHRLNGCNEHKVSRPSFNALPLQSHHPKASAWGLWGSDDQLGTLNLLADEAVRSAATEIQDGLCVPLNLPLDVPKVPMNPLRKPLAHNIIQKGHANDDEIHINTQASTQWDGPRHYPYQDLALGGRRFYNGAAQSDLVLPDGSTTCHLGIQNAAQRGIVGRGVLLDWRAYAVRNGIQYSPFASHGIPLRELQAVAAEQGVEFHVGDILLIRTGWTKAYLKLSEREQLALAACPARSHVGVEATKEMLQWHWDNAFAAVASDTNAYEVWPPTRPWGVSCHEVFLSGWGMPIGELWDLERLAEECRKRKRWTFFLTSSPLNLSGGVASPANAMVSCLVLTWC